MKKTQNYGIDMQGWKATHPLHLIKRNNRRAKKLGCPGRLNIQVLRDFFHQYDPPMRCLACGATECLTLDHIVPLWHGGANRLHNLQPLCEHCNSLKGRQIIDYRRPIATLPPSLVG
jgi:5-methylcytosine-specific restriction endonuclease McrA